MKWAIKVNVKNLSFGTQSARAVSLLAHSGITSSHHQRQPEPWTASHHAWCHIGFFDPQLHRLIPASPPFTIIVTVYMMNLFSARIQRA